MDFPLQHSGQAKNRPSFATVISWPDPQAPYMPWGWNQAGEGPLGEWVIEFMEKVQRRRLNYTLSAWWFNAASDHWNNLPAADRQSPCGGAGHLAGAWLPAPGDCGGVWDGRAYCAGAATAGGAALPAGTRALGRTAPRIDQKPVRSTRELDRLPPAIFSPAPYVPNLSKPSPDGP